MWNDQDRKTEIEAASTAVSSSCSLYWRSERAQVHLKWVAALAGALACGITPSVAQTQEVDADFPSILVCTTKAMAELQKGSAGPRERASSVTRNFGGSITSPDADDRSDLDRAGTVRLPKSLSFAPVLASLCPVMLIEAGHPQLETYCAYASTETWECEPTDDGGVAIAFSDALLRR